MTTDSNRFENRITEEVRRFGFELEREQTERLFRFFCMLKEYNNRLNLTAITEDDEIISKHFVDSMAIGLIGKDTLLPRSGLKAIDVGTGAGFPGLVIKIVRPDIDMTLLDARNKKLAFIEDVIKSTGLTGVRTLHARAEEIGGDRAYRERFDLVTARAVRNMQALSEYCLPLVRPEGSFAAYKADFARAEIDEALKAIEILGGRIDEIAEYSLDEGGSASRIILNIRKIKKTPDNYPRRQAQIERIPIG